MQLNGTSDGYSFSEANYNAGLCGKGHSLSKNINQVDATTYDAATVNIGAPWKMFTQAKGQELIDNTTYQWTTINGVNGGKFTSKSDSTKYIFLPACGHWVDKDHYSTGIRGAYWSTKLGDSVGALYLVSDSSGVYTNYYSRYFGYSIRPASY